ncbi:ABC-2 transporter permease [Bacillus manliponensis]|uniref:ABC-2 transporter permease n=1 Tax=Bacillus manliponensis TaxID=574376 RepID=UPI0035182826
MKYLLYKDFSLQKYVSIIHIFSAIVILLSMRLEQNAFAVSSMVIGGIGASTAYIEGRNNSESILASLPLLRKEIVVAKYVSNGIFILIGIPVIYTIAVYMAKSGGASIPWHVVLTGILCAVIFSSFVMPLQYLTSQQMVTVLAVVVIFPIVIMCGMFANIPAETVGPLSEWIGDIERSITLLIIICGVFACYFISLFVSIKLYEGREL